MPITNRYFVLHMRTPSINVPVILPLWWHEPEEGPTLPDFASFYPEVYEYLGPGTVHSIHESTIVCGNAASQSIEGADNAIFGQVLQDYGHRYMLKLKVMTAKGVNDEVKTCTTWTSALESDIEDWWLRKGREAFRHPEHSRRLMILALVPDSGGVLRERKVFETTHTP